jgi:hypothetical protein
MNNLWQCLPVPERQASVQATAREKNIDDRAVEKDWWVTVILKALFNTECGPFLLFKGGTSLSKGWRLIQLFICHGHRIATGRNQNDLLCNSDFRRKSE